MGSIPECHEHVEHERLERERIERERFAHRQEHREHREHTRVHRGNEPQHAMHNGHDPRGRQTAHRGTQKPGLLGQKSGQHNSMFTRNTQQHGGRTGTNSMLGKGATNKGMIEQIHVRAEDEETCYRIAEPVNG